MSEREQEILKFIIVYREQNSLSPSIREIGEGIGLHSTSSVQKYIHSLLMKGYLQQTKGKTRSLVPIGSPCDVNENGVGTEVQMTG